MYGNGNGTLQGGAGGFAPPQMLDMPGTITPRTAAVSEQVAGLAKRTEALHQAISLLEQRIDCVVRPAPPAPQSGEKQPTPSVSMASALLEMNNRLEHALQRLDSLLNRIEL